MTDFARERRRALDRHRHSRRLLRWLLPLIVSLGIVISFVEVAWRFL